MQAWMRDILICFRCGQTNLFFHQRKPKISCTNLNGLLTPRVQYPLCFPSFTKIHSSFSRTNSLAVGKNYFPQPNKRPKSPKAQMRMMKDVVACQDLISTRKFDEEIYTKGIRTAITLGMLNEADAMSQIGLSLSPENKVMVKLVNKVKSRIQTKTFYYENAKSNEVKE